MKKILPVLLSAFVITGCSSFSISTEIENKKGLKPAKTAGVYFRLPRRTFVTEKDYRVSLGYWVAGYQNLKKFTLPEGISEELGIYSSGMDRFYQLDPEKDFLTFKSLGVVKNYLQKNRDEIEKIMVGNSLDLLIIYEVDGFFQAELQYVDFNSIIVAVDKSMNVVFMDRQQNSYHIDEINPEKIKKHLLDKVSQRFIETMIDIDFLKEK